MTLKEQYKRERRRVLSLIRRYKNQGYDLEITVPAIPKRITQGSIRRLQKITPEYVRKHAYAPDIETGEKITYYQYKYRYQKRFGTPVQASQKNIVFSWMLANEYVDMLVSDYHELTRGMVQEKLASLRAKHGDKKVGLVLEEMISKNEIVAPKDSYNYLLVDAMLKKFVAYLEFTKEEEQELRRIMDEENGAMEEYEGEIYG